MLAIICDDEGETLNDSDLVVHVQWKQIVRRMFIILTVGCMSMQLFLFIYIWQVFPWGISPSTHGTDKSVKKKSYIRPWRVNLNFVPTIQRHLSGWAIVKWILKCGQPSTWFLLNEHLVHLEQFITEAQSTTMTRSAEIQASNCQKRKGKNNQKCPCLHRKYGSQV